MKILIVEDVTLIAERVERLTKLYLQQEITSIKISHILDEAKLLIKENNYDLLFLDLNLNGQDGFELLRETVSNSFKTIVITANKNEAARAFDLGVFDFISKPITKDRFQIAMQRLSNALDNGNGFVNYVSIKSHGKIELIELCDIVYIKAAGHYSEIITIKNKVHLCEKNLEKLTPILPNNFFRIHRSFIVNNKMIKQIFNHGGGKYEAEMCNENLVPINRNSYKEIKNMLNL